MREIKFLDGVSVRYQEAMNLIDQTSRQDPSLGSKLEQSFWQCWNQLMRILHNRPLEMDYYQNEVETYTLLISPDFVKGSFAFCFKVGERVDLNGGMILHGFQETFSVELSGMPHPHWSIHT